MRARFVTISAMGILLALSTVSAIRADYDPPQPPNPVLVGKFFPGPYYVKYLALKPGWRAYGSPSLPITKPVSPIHIGDNLPNSFGHKALTGSSAGLNLGAIGGSDAAATPEARLEQKLKTLASSLR